MEAARPTHMVNTSLFTYLIVSYIAKPAVTDPPGLFIYRKIGLDNVNYKSELVVEETFGPIVPVIRVHNDDEKVMDISNSTAFCLSSDVCRNDLKRIT